jgi:hypothetical protein
MARARYQHKFVEKIEDRDPTVMWLDRGGYVVPDGNRYAAVADRLVVIRGADILMQTRLLGLGERVDRGRVVVAITPSWHALRSEALKTPSLMDHFPLWHRKFEEFVAGGYFASRWSDVILSPRSHDGGFDVAARKQRRQILDEAKAYKPSLVVNHQIVRAVLGLLTLHDDVHQVRITTTSSFAPTVVADFGRMIPHKLWLRDRPELLRWLASIGSVLN